ncbi:MAG TPA: helix-turn-helix transcriptional regulator [Solirubrobacterales bacterium]|nr:helix-turn-helix transcriptional regulator [Solirubrobacterales bacterium]
MGESTAVARRFGENLRRARAEEGISQEELGFRSGLHRTEIGLLERGARVPRLDTLLKLASGLGVRIACPLFEGIEWTPGGVVTRPGAFSFATPLEEGDTGSAGGATAEGP